MNKPIIVNDETNICLKCKFSKVKSTKTKNTSGENVTRCECNYSDTPGKGAGYRKSCKTFEAKV